VPAHTGLKMSLDTHQRRVSTHFSTIPETYADAYSQECSPTTFFFKRREEIVTAFLHSLAGGRILDVGCGPGIYAPICTGQGFGYDGLDISEGMIEEARRRFGDLPGVEFTVGGMQKLPFPSNTFDALLCLGAFEYIPESQQELCLKELIRVVKPNGVLLFSLLNKNSLYWRWVEYGFPLMKFAYRNAKAHVTSSAPIKWKGCSAETMPTSKFKMAHTSKMLRSRGLSIVGGRYYALNLVPPPLDNKLAALSVWVSSKFERMLVSPLLGWLGMAFVIFAEKG
jgi:ubiquinone/menaquinone biosynthesis C-methylase UbiE